MVSPELSRPPTPPYQSFGFNPTVLEVLSININLWTVGKLAVLYNREQQLR